MITAAEARLLSDPHSDDAIERQVRRVAASTSAQECRVSLLGLPDNERGSRFSSMQAVWGVTRGFTVTREQGEGFDRVLLSWDDQG